MRTFLTILLLFAGFVHAQQNTKDAVTLDAKAFRQKSSAPNAVILDVRTPEEVSQGIIPGAKVIDYKTPDFAAKISALDKSKTYFVYCKGGVRSSRAVALMKEKGFSQVHELDGGFDEWSAQGYPVQKP